MRLYCEFGDCSCPCYMGRGKCRRCGHAKCWHKRSTQFDSVRESARVPTYQRIPIVPAVFVPMAPPISPLESEEEENYCTTGQLPV